MGNNKNSHGLLYLATIRAFKDPSEDLSLFYLYGL